MAMCSTSDRQQQLQIYSLTSYVGVFCDAIAVDNDGRLVFASLWGHDTAIQGLLGCLQLGNSEGGIDRLAVEITDSAQVVPAMLGKPGAWVPRVDDYDKLTGRVLRPTGVHGTVVHLFLFEKRVRESIGASARSFLLSQTEDTSEQTTELWMAVKQCIALPLLDAWQAPLLEHLQRTDALKPLVTLGIRGWEIHIAQPEDLEAWISSNIKCGILPGPALLAITEEACA